MIWTVTGDSNTNRDVPLLVLLLFEEKEKGGCLGAAKVGYKYMAGQGQVNPCESSGTYLHHSAASRNGSASALEVPALTHSHLLDS